ncbi:unnamed protein product [Meloidogyne enterolobii]|uniref:Uncharacterized protein n=1 Tax=Meloidogyne enterolobii TaxID=390850 RepID=A0ACB0YDW5_MELEN
MIFALSYIVETFKNFIVLFTYSNPCDCLTQVWLVYLIRIPGYLYILGLTMFHLFIMIERVLATVFVKIYENQGNRIAVLCTIFVWLLTSIFVLYVYISSSMDVDTFSHPMVYITLTSIYNSQVLSNINYFFLSLAIFIAVGDYFVIHRNRKIKANFFSSVSSYSLSKSYQSKQNILFMRVIFPLDFSYSFVFALFNILSTFIRYKREEYGQLTFLRTYEFLILVNNVKFYPL